MAKTRAQRKAERRAREAQGQQKSAPQKESTAQHDTQVGKSGEVAEVEAVEAGIAAGAPEAELETPGAPQRTRAERRAAEKEERELEKRRRDNQRRQEREQLAKRQKQATAEGKQRGRVISFLISCWAELKKVQWPDRDTLVQATAVTVIFVAIAATYLGALDAAFSWLVKQVL